MDALCMYKHYLIEEEKSELTIEKYLRDVRAFLRWTEGRELTKALVKAYKEDLRESYAVASINSMLASINSYLSFVGRSDCRVKNIKQQRRIFCAEEKELTRQEYQRLLQASQNKPQICLLMQTICATGIRVSEHRFITVEAARMGVAEVSCKGKTRTVLLTKKLCRSLLKYAKGKGIQSGSIFITKQGNPLNRSSIWAEMKKLCKAANVLAEKVFPHNLRHLFARTYYALVKDIVRLADILGHANINTTRIYTMESGIVHRQQIEKMRLVI